MALLAASVLFFFALYHSSSAAINWNGNSWAMGCDFVGKDISNARVPGEQCGGQCAKTSGCTHFTWTKFNGGTCRMKSGGASKSDAIQSKDQGMVCGVMSSGPSSGPRQPYEATSPPPNGKWQQVWIDNFDSFDNNPRTNNKWSFDLGNDWQNTAQGWGNGEYQYYTSNKKNIRAENGNLIIEIQVETGSKPRSSNGVTFDLTSARIATRGHASWGVNHRFLARAKLPTARATWPAFWHLPEAQYPGDPGAQWPRGGELDTMEHWAKDVNMVKDYLFKCNCYPSYFTKT